MFYPNNYCVFKVLRKVMSNQEYYNETRDYSVLGAGADTANVQARREANNNAVEVEQEKQRDQDVKGFVTDAFNKATSDARQEFMHDINGRHFSDADLEEALNDIIDNKEEFQAENKLTDEEADLAVTHAIIMKGMSPEQRDDYLKDLSETNPRVANAIADKAETIGTNLENKADPNQTASVSETERQAQILSQTETTNNKGSFENLSKIASTGTTETFNSMANATEVEPTQAVEAPKPTVPESVFDSLG